MLISFDPANNSLCTTIKCLNKFIFSIHYPVLAIYLPKGAAYPSYNKKPVSIENGFFLGCGHALLRILRVV